MKTTRIFTYGTLMTGQPNHRLLTGARMLGAARTEARFDLVDLGPFPGMVTGGSTAIAGEVYAVDRETLTALDRLEGHPRFYERRTIRLANGQRIAAYIYPQRPPGCPLVPGGDWRNAKGV